MPGSCWRLTMPSWRPMTSGSSECHTEVPFFDLPVSVRMGAPDCKAMWINDLYVRLRNKSPIPTVLMHPQQTNNQCHQCAQGLMGCANQRYIVKLEEWCWSRDVFHSVVMVCSVAWCEGVIRQLKVIDVLAANCTAGLCMIFFTCASILGFHEWFHVSCACLHVLLLITLCASRVLLSVVESKYIYSRTVVLKYNVKVLYLNINILCHSTPLHFRESIVLFTLLL